jgi:hypothetical protein
VAKGTFTPQDIETNSPYANWPPYCRYSSFFLVLSHTFGYLEQKLKMFFLKSNFYVGENFKFQCDPFSNKKDVSKKVQLPPMGRACQKWHVLFLDIFQRNSAQL